MDIKEYGIEEVKDPLSPEDRERLETAFGEIATIEVKGKVFGFRLPNRNEVRRYRQTVARKDANSDDEMEKLLIACAVYPSADEFRVWSEKYPMALGSTGIAFMKASGFDFSKVDLAK